LRDLRGKVAVVTGAASGIGLALTEAFLSEGMKVAMADVEAPSLDEAAGRLLAQGADVLPVVTDVRHPESVGQLAQATYERYGTAHVVCNNAGVSPVAAPWELSLGEWRWILDVNLWGVIHGTRTFVPRLLEQGEGHVVNTASLAGLVSGALSAYSVTKHAVVALSEATYFSLQMAGSQVGVSVLCPGFVRTRIHQSERNRPPEAASGRARDPALEEVSRALVLAGSDPVEVGRAAAEAVRTGRFYVLTHPGSEAGVMKRAKDIVTGGPPSFPEITGPP
jgi:NAD(P)-dependent dehydrogenase (short-subunit alcohol dehydrogenase family)